MSSNDQSRKRMFPCNQSGCAEEFLSLMNLVVHTLDEHADPPDGSDPYEKFIEEIEARR